jgi:hypothetical protein
MKSENIEIVIINDKSYVRFSAYQKLKAQMNLMKNHQNCRYHHFWAMNEILEDDELQYPCNECVQNNKWGCICK